MKIDHHQTICVKHNISPVGGGGDCGVAVPDEAETVLATRIDIHYNTNMLIIIYPTHHLVLPAMPASHHQSMDQNQP